MPELAVTQGLALASQPAVAQAMSQAAAPDLWLFFLLVVGIIALPGMDMAFVAGSALSAGLRGGLAAVAGIVAGGVVHVAVAATGVAALWLAWPAGFNALLLAGAAYMAWIGCSLLRVRAAGPLGATVDGPRRGWAIFRRGTLTCLLNPKAYAFTLALFPAFVHSDSRSLLAQTLAMGLITVGTQIAVYGTVAALAVRARALIEARQSLIARATGAMLMASALLTAAQAWAG